MELIAEELVHQLPDDASRNIFIINKYRIEHGMPRWKKHHHLIRIMELVEEYKKTEKTDLSTTF